MARMGGKRTLESSHGVSATPHLDCCFRCSIRHSFAMQRKPQRVLLRPGEKAVTEYRRGLEKSLVVTSGRIDGAFMSAAPIIRRGTSPSARTNRPRRKYVRAACLARNNTGRATAYLSFGPYPADRMESSG